MFETLEALPADAILKLIAEHAADTRPEKVDLGVGVYRDEHGQTPIPTAVKKAEQRIVETQTSKAYLGQAGAAEFNACMQDLTFGASLDDPDRVTTIQTPGGSGSLRIAAGLLLRARPGASIWVSDPTWNNHVPLLGGAGLKLEAYPYYDSDRNRLRYEDMLATLETIPEGDVVLLHGCCHNPTGMDPTRAQWDGIAEVIARRRLIPFVDIAYQGLADGLEEDRYAIERLAADATEMLVSSSCSKNFALYRDRVGTLSVLSADAPTNSIVRSQLLQLVRTMYSAPPDHGAAIVATILSDGTLTQEWRTELDEMRQRLASIRGKLVDALGQAAPGQDFSHIETANGMFSFLGVTPEQVQRLKSDYGVYLVDSGRINVAGITEGNVGYLAESIGKVL